MYSKVVDLLKSLYVKTLNTIITRKSVDGVEYVWKRRYSKALVIVFSGMGDARYNYMRSLSDTPIDQLFIRDCWAGNASYYWFENKSNHPEIATQRLIEKVLVEGHYETVITAGSSKGGTAAIYYGLKNSVAHVVAGACQYYVGDYLSHHQIQEHPEQWQSVVGLEIDETWVKLLDEKLAMMIEQHRGCSTQLHLLYSTQEHTYDEHVLPLLNKLEECGIAHSDQVEHFPRHSMVGDFFKHYLPQKLVKCTKKS